MFSGIKAAPRDAGSQSASPAARNMLMTSGISGKQGLFVWFVAKKKTISCVPSDVLSQQDESWTGNKKNNKWKKMFHLGLSHLHDPSGHFSVSAPGVLGRVVQPPRSSSRPASPNDWRCNCLSKLSAYLIPLFPLLPPLLLLCTWQETHICTQIMKLPANWERELHRSATELPVWMNSRHPSWLRSGSEAEGRKKKREEEEKKCSERPGLTGWYSGYSPSSLFPPLLSLLLFIWSFPCFWDSLNKTWADQHVLLKP